VKRTSKVLVTAVAAAAVALGSLAASGSAGAQSSVRGVTDDTIKVGGLGYTAFYEEASKTAQARFEIANDNNEIPGGRKIDFVEFADDNSFASRSHAKALLRALIAEDVRWFTEADISIAADAELLDLMRESGCRQVLIGLESPTPDGLDGIEVKRNWKLARLPDYEAAIDAIQSRGITVNGCFILGLDGDTERTFDAIYDFIDRTALFEAQLTVLTPFPGTPLYERLLREGRLIEPRAWEKCTLFDVNFHPRNMSADRLQQGLLDLARRVYDPAFIHDRRRRFFERLHASGVRPGPGLPAEAGAVDAP